MRTVDLEGVIASSGFDTGDRVVVGDWASGPLGAMTDVMWARPDGERVLVAPSREVADLVTSVYRFDRVELAPFEVRRDGRVLSVNAGPVRVRMAAGAAVPFPPRPAWVTRYLEGPVARALLGVETYGRSPTGVEEWYRTIAVRRLTWARLSVDGDDAGAMRDVDPPVGVGFSEPPPWPSMVRVRPRLRFPGDGPDRDRDPRPPSAPPEAPDPSGVGIHEPSSRESSVRPWILDAARRHHR